MTTSTFRTKNFTFIWEKSQRGNSRVSGIVNGEFAATIDYRGSFCEGVRTKDVRHLVEAHAFAEEVRNFSGSWEPYSASERPEKVGQSEKTGRKNSFHVYFWTLKDGSPRHHKALCNVDPKGEELWAMFRQNPYRFMTEHPELCSRRRR